MGDHYVTIDEGCIAKFAIKLVFFTMRFDMSLENRIRIISITNLLLLYQQDIVKMN